MAETSGKPIKCKAAVAWEPRQPLCIETVEVAPPGKDEVRIKMVATGLCHTDLSMLDGMNAGTVGDPTVFPRILGHEGGGIVESCGDGVTSVEPGDHVLTVMVPHCGRCVLCQHPSANLCLMINNPAFSRGQMQDGTSRFTCNGETIYHFTSTSTLSQYTVVPEACVAKINAQASLKSSCLLACGVSTGYGAAVNTAKVHEGSSVAIWGLGAVGLSVVMGCKQQGAAIIIGIDVVNDKKDIAMKMGCTHFVNPRDQNTPILDTLMELTGLGPDYTFECIGNPVTVAEAFKCCQANFGVSVMVGMPGEDQYVSFCPHLLLTGRTLKGSPYGGWRGRQDIPKLVAMYQEGTLPLDPLITHTMELDRVNDAIDLMKSAKAVRCIITF